MGPKLLKVIIPSVLVLLLIACTAPIQNVENAPVNVSSAIYDLADVTKAIQRAGAILGWQMKEETPGHIVGTLYIRRHMAKVDIVYTLDEYSIVYRDSSNLKYDLASDSIHKNYNVWIQELSSAINVQLITF